MNIDPLNIFSLKKLPLVDRIKAKNEYAQWRTRQRWNDRHGKKYRRLISKIQNINGELKRLEESQ